ncbi:PKD domain containing protein [Mangrovihabitans endophyticus]|uniref:Delta-60 repeat domain-containing protein n=1 Tax=Mangrovihabitans endophyticus TaxID=1751298 RepID=A0A8J3C0X9_9ACTN|nr:PKD domain containing protein [Mangrovihabitans endophyticus]GGL02752.1 hypothetical protein GCM10012284_41690 [Mangrovihabitans endophyticus]
MRRRSLAAILLSLSLSASAASVATPAAATDRAYRAVVSANPVNNTPHVLNGTVWALTQVGDTIVVGGSFTKVTDASGKRTYARRNIFAYGLRDGAIRSFAPSVDGSVYALATGRGGTVYIGGSFRRVNGAAQRGVAQLRLSDGARMSTFRAYINWGDVRTLHVQGGRMYLGGAFSAIRGVRRVALARLDPATGNVIRSFDARLSAPGLARTRVEHFDVSPDGRRLVAVGALLKSGSATRTQIVVLNTARGTAALASWYTTAFQPSCMKGFDTYLRQVKFSPDGRYFVVVSTGRMSSPTRLCDAAARFETYRSGRVNPTWVQRTGGDSLYAVAVTGSAVYLGGHQRYLDNPYGTDAKGPGPGAKSRVGIGAVSATTGRALSWNPTRSRGVGVRAFLTTTSGLIVGSDTDKLGKEYHGRVGMFPIS